MALKWVMPHIRRKQVNRCTSNHINLILFTENSALPHEFLHDMVLDPRQLRFQCYIALLSGTAAPQQLQAWITTTNTIIYNMLSELAGRQTIKHTWTQPQPPQCWLLSIPYLHAGKDTAPSDVLPAPIPVLSSSTGFCGESSGMHFGPGRLESFEGKQHNSTWARDSISRERMLHQTLPSNEPNQVVQSQKLTSTVCTQLSQLVTPKANPGLQQEASSQDQVRQGLISCPPHPKA